jgi:hypothetical protein
MTGSLWLVTAATVLALGFAQVPVAAAATENSQQQKMTACNAEAKSKALSGDSRKHFMSDCLSAHPAPTATGNSQQEKMKACNAQAKTAAPTGDAHKQFMSKCLKGGTAPSAAGGTSGGADKK